MTLLEKFYAETYADAYAEAFAESYLKTRSELCAEAVTDIAPESYETIVDLIYNELMKSSFYRIYKEQYKKALEEEKYKTSIEKLNKEQ